MDNSQKLELVTMLIDSVRLHPTARHYGLIAVTDNLKHFNPMPDVEVENWIKRSEKD